MSTIYTDTDTITDIPLPGFRDIVKDVSTEHEIKKFHHNDIYINNKAGTTKYVIVNYHLEHIDIRSGQPFDDNGKKFTYKLTDQYEIQSYEYTLEPVYDLDEEGNQLLDEEGNPIQSIDEQGELVFEKVEVENSRITIQARKDDLSTWDSAVGLSFSIGILNRISIEQRLS